MNRRGFGQGVAALLLPTPAPRFKLGTKSADLAPRDVPFQLSVMLWTVFTDLPFEQRLEKVAEAGYKCVELVGEYEKWSPQDFERANAKRKQLGITFDTTAGLKRSLCNPDERQAMLAEFRSALEPMEKLDCPHMIMLSGNVAPGMSREIQHQSCVDGLKAAASFVEGQKIAGMPVQIFLETIDPEENPRYYLTSANEAFEIVRAVNHPQVKFLYDFFHEQIAEGNLIEKLEKNIQYVGLVHIADVPGRHQPGTGEINYSNIFRKLAELKYAGVAAMEFHPTGDPVAQLRAAREMALRSAASS